MHFSEGFFGSRAAVSPLERLPFLPCLLPDTHIDQLLHSALWLYKYTICAFNLIFRRYMYLLSCLACCPTLTYINCSTLLALWQSSNIQYVELNLFKRFMYLLSHLKVFWRQEQQQTLPCLLPDTHIDQLLHSKRKVISNSTNTQCVHLI